MAARLAWGQCRNGLSLSSSAWRLQASRAFSAVSTSTAASPVGLAALLDMVAREPAPTATGTAAGTAAAVAPPVHIIHSTGRNPFANLAVEHRLFEHAHPAGHLLLLYRNAPCVVIGRNQNPWAEVALPAVAAGGGWHEHVHGQAPVLLRRRSGGGTVYHDAGNANWSVHTPAAGSFDFDRDRHASMVVRALQRLGVAGARVNERHDIVVTEDGHGGCSVDYKVSGSAYKLTTRRALHHGTCLLGADLAAVARALHAPPAAPYVKARGVASVRSPVTNLELPDASAFAGAVADEFQALYGPATTHSIVDVDGEIATVAAADDRLAKGLAELQSLAWLFGQTPQFSFATRPTDDDPRPRPPRPASVPVDFHLAFTARHGRLQDVVVEGLSDSAAVAAALDGRVLHEIRDWQAVLGPAADPAIGTWLDHLLGVRVNGT